MGSWERKVPVSLSKARCFSCLLQCFFPSVARATSIKITGKEFITNSDSGISPRPTESEFLGVELGNLEFTSAPGFINLKYLGLDYSNLTNLTVCVSSWHAKKHLVVV